MTQEDYGKPHVFRLNDDDFSRLQDIADYRGLSGSEAVRRLIREADLPTGDEAR